MQLYDSFSDLRSGATKAVKLVVSSHFNDNKKYESTESRKEASAYLLEDDQFLCSKVVHLTWKCVH